MRTVLPIAACLLLAACASPTPPATTATAKPSTAASAKHVKTPWDSLIKDENKAKNVQQTVNAHAKKLQQAIEKQSQ